jgi:hypothetical protein
MYVYIYMRDQDVSSFEFLCDIVWYSTLLFYKCLNTDKYIKLGKNRWVYQQQFVCTMSCPLVHTSLTLMYCGQVGIFAEHKWDGELN